LCEKLRESPKLRMLVPRVYGLGDLSQILDERAYEQAQAVLQLMGPDLRKFVLTESYTKAARAVIERGFVLLLGQPAAGKSTIAATLAVGASDVFGCRPMKVDSPEELKQHWNTHERQFFWVDDAFGPTQYERDWTIGWNKVFPEMRAAIERGSRILFTSRDYIFRAAQSDLKTSAFPLLANSQVVVEVERLSSDERAQILYNHVRLGKQPKKFRTSVKPHLDAVASHGKFLPEIARRLGDPMFTSAFVVSRDSLLKFVDEPEHFLCDVMRGLGPAMKGAVALVFMRAGVLESPVVCSPQEASALSRLGTTEAAATKALQDGNGSFFLFITEGPSNSWRFRHPTMRDAFAALVAGDAELLEIYLRGAPVGRLVREVTCGRKLEFGERICVPTTLFSIVAARLRELPPDSVWHRNWEPLLHFLSWRCSKDFLALYIKEDPELFQKARLPGAYLGAYASSELVPLLHRHGLLPESERQNFVQQVKRITRTTLDTGCLEDGVRTIFTDDELTACIDNLSEFVARSLDDEILDTKRSFNPKEDSSGDSCFESLTDHLDALNEELASRNDAKAQEIRSAIAQGLNRIGKLAEELDAERPEENDDGWEEVRFPQQGDSSDSRSIFEDVDS
jgi:hypothetical protein